MMLLLKLIDQESLFLLPFSSAKELGIKDTLPAYLDPIILPQDLVSGVMFASGGSGFDPLTPKLVHWRLGLLPSPIVTGIVAEMEEVVGGVEEEKWTNRWVSVWRWERLLALWGLPCVGCCWRKLRSVVIEVAVEEKLGLLGLDEGERLLVLSYRRL
ncbi:hypothetical protein POTOM_009325 [Populus tomentosa]|uniref:Uncharacterized protein n=1 Tax=Populus tomentosa TaxID=118781 RepID=A0A8X8ABU0_POPTO|nr:hypothetical protein POTOM_009325 [Populus tomentosa]